jgi:hypothetical protein
MKLYKHGSKETTDAICATHDSYSNKMAGNLLGALFTTEELLNSTVKGSKEHPNILDAEKLGLIRGNNLC